MMIMKRQVREHQKSGPIKWSKAVYVESAGGGRSLTRSSAGGPQPALTAFTGNPDDLYLH